MCWDQRCAEQKGHFGRSHSKSLPLPIDREPREKRHSDYEMKSLKAPFVAFGTSLLGDKTAAPALLDEGMNPGKYSTNRATSLTLICFYLRRGLSLFSLWLSMWTQTGYKFINPPLASAS